MTLFQCIGCGRAYVATPAFCRCGQSDFGAALAAGRGRVYSCTTLYAAAEANEKDLPFQIAIVELEEGARLTARITGPVVAIGDAVELAGESDGVYRFRAATT
jgi:uncharacterized OB-fold protein